jgi:multidrug resistance protein, MATE family
MSTSIRIAGTAAPARTAGGVRELSLLAFPILLQTISETLCQTANSALVGQLGAAQLAGVGLSGIWIWTLVCPFIGIGTGVQVFAARADGAGHPEECGPWIWCALCVVLPATALWALALRFAFAPLIAALGSSQDLQMHAIAYAGPRLLGFPAIAMGLTLAAFLRGIGNTRIPMLASMAAVLFDLVLAYGLVFGRLGLPAWGVYGAGFAFMCTEWLYAFLLLGCLALPSIRRYRTLEPCIPAGRDVVRFLRTSAPIGGQYMLDMTSFALFSSIVARMGEQPMAASQAMLQLLSLSFQQAYAIALGAGTLVGRYLGAADPEAVQRSYRSAFQLMSGLCAGVAILFVAAPEVLMRLFSSDTQVLALARPLLVLGAAFQVIDAIGIVAGGCLRGAGDTRWPFAVQATLAWAVRLPLVWLFAIRLEGGVLGAWIGELGYLSVLMIALLHRFRAGRWKSLKL